MVRFKARKFDAKTMASDHHQHSVRGVL